MSRYRYGGEELCLFAAAVNWKRYIRSVVQPYVVGDVLEVGAGIGGTTRVFCDGRQRSWTCLEPDPELAATLERNVGAGQLPLTPIVAIGDSRDVPAGRTYDTIIYIDVLEHIEDDRAELSRACALLNARGTLIVLSPAHEWLYTSFDKGIGHFRRYNRRTLATLTQPGTNLEVMRYLDAAGLLPSCANRFFLRSSHPTRQQVLWWDRWCIPASRHVDRLLGWRIGKSIIAVWRRDGR